MNQFKTALRLLGAATLALALFAPTAQAAEPNPGYEQFAGCPSTAEVPSVVACVRTTVTGGNFQMGSKDVPITDPIVLTGGQNLKGELFANAEGGMSMAKQKVPGGVIGLTGLTWLLELFGSEALTLYAVTELAGQPKLSGSNSIQLPIRVHLVNGVLGNNCYVGSFTSPIVLNLTTQTTEPPPPNEPISGTQPTNSFDEETEILTFEDGVFVDNSFAAPGANGCTLTLFGFIPISINGLVNSQSGLPAPAGTNETKQEFDLEFTPVFNVY